MLYSRTDYTVAEIAAMMGISIPTIYRHAAKGLVGLKKVGGRTLVAADEFNRYRQGHPSSQSLVE